MNRRDILQRRHYAAVPKATLARTDLTAAAKVVYTSLIGHLFSDDADQASPSTAALARTSGLGRRTVVRALCDLQAASLIAAVARPGLPTVYTFPTADAPEPKRLTPCAKTAQVQRPEPEPKRPTTCANLTGACAKTAHPYKDVERFKEHIELPILPKTPEGVFNGKSQNPTEKTADEAIAGLVEAYRRATGRQMPAKWVDQAVREFNVGDRAMVCEIDAAAISRGMRYAQGRKISFAFATLVLSIHQTPTSEAAAERAGAAGQKNSQTDEAHRRLAAHDAELQAKTDAAMEYFYDDKKIDEAARNRWRAQIAARPGAGRCTPEGREALAALAAHGASLDSESRQATA
jgi:hypothetical protein